MLRLDALSRGCRRSCARTDYLFSGDDACQFGRACRAGLCAGRAISQVAAQEEADAAVDAHLAEMYVRLLYVALESLVAELPGNRVCPGVDPTRGSGPEATVDMAGTSWKPSRSARTMNLSRSRSRSPSSCAIKLPPSVANASAASPDFNVRPFM
jgi:hypothetical protein